MRNKTCKRRPLRGDIDHQLASYKSYIQELFRIAYGAPLHIVNCSSFSMSTCPVLTALMP